MVSSGWKVLGVVPGKPRNGRTIAIQVSESGGRFSFGVGFVQADGSFKPTAFLQDRDIEEYVALLFAAKRALDRAVAEKVLEDMLFNAMVNGVLAMLGESARPAEPEVPMPPSPERVSIEAARQACVTQIGVPVDGAGASRPLRATLGDFIRAKGAACPP